MNRETALGLLSVTNTGNDILTVLDIIQSDVLSDNQSAVLSDEQCSAMSYSSGETVTFWLIVKNLEVT